MRILLLGSLDFAEPLRALGHQVVVLDRSGNGCAQTGQDSAWGDLKRLLNHGRDTVDAVVVSDNVGHRTLPTGLWDAGPVTAFYGLDAPINAFWQTSYARLFDVALLDQPMQSELLAGQHPGAGWLPVGIDPSLYQGDIPDMQTPGVCFVGVVNEAVRPKRSALLAKVDKIAPLTVRGGRKDQWFPTLDSARLYRSHQVMLNENLFNGVTTRPLEGMASGACVLSEAAPGAMDRLFKDGEHLLFFGPLDLEQKLKFLLGDDGLRRRLAEAGREEVLGRHTLTHRAQELVRRLELAATVPSDRRPRARAGEALRLEGEALTMAALRWPKRDGAVRLERGAGRLTVAANDGADPLLGARSAGLACFIAGNLRRARSFLARAAEQGSAGDALRLALAHWRDERPDQARLALARLPKDHPGLSEGPGDAGFHLAAARLLTSEGQGLSEGFNRQKLAPLAWTALEHLVEATRLEPGLALAWEMCGDLVMEHGAPNQAHFCYLRAMERHPHASLKRKIQTAAQEGYLA